MQDTMTVRERQASMRQAQQERESLFRAWLFGIEHALRTRGTPAQQIACALLLLLLTFARLPGGGYACQSAMFSVLIRLGFCVPAAFAGVLAGFAASYLSGNLVSCWQLPVCVLLWLSAGLWAGRKSRFALSCAVFCAQLTSAAVTGVASLYAWATLVLTALAGASISVLYLGAALISSRRDELDGDTRPLCVMAVCASMLGALLALPHGGGIACALAAYLTIEHAHAGGGRQALLCAGVLGGVLFAGMGNVQPLCMLGVGGFLAGEIKARSRASSALLMALGMAAASALVGGTLSHILPYAYGVAGLLPFLILPASLRSGILGFIEQDTPQRMSQSGAIAARSAAMIHAWAGLYGETARLMKGLADGGEDNAPIQACIGLLQKTSGAANQICERTLSQTQPDDDAYRRIRYALARAGVEHVQVVYALRVGEQMEVLLLKPEHVAAAALQDVVSRGCRAPMRAVSWEGMLSTQALFEQQPALELEVGAATRSRSGEAVTGDCYLSRQLAGGRHVLALSDGMGSGAAALQESHAALHLMLESLRAGYTRAQALDVVNALMLMCTGREMYATMDLCVIELHSGEAAFEKLGACASYVVRGGEVRTLGADTLPVGILPDVEVKSLRMTLHDGDVVIMMTDGVVQGYPGGETEICAAIAKHYWLHPRAVGERLIAGALAGGEAKDDMAVLCAKVMRAAIR